METIRKSADGSTIIVKRSLGYAVSTKTARWEQERSFRGTMVTEWKTEAKGLTLPQAEALFARITAKAA